MWAGVFTALSEIGGIQQVSRHTGAVLEEMARERGESCLLLSLNDQRGLQTFVVAHKEYSFVGFGRSKLRLVSHAIRLAPRLRVVYLGHVNLAPLGLLLRLFNHGLRYWVTGHGVEMWYPVSLIRRLALRWVTGVVAVSTFTRERVITVQGVPQDKVVVLCPGVDPDFDDAPNRKDPLSLPPESRVILSVGRLVSSEPGKGIDTVIRALPKVLRAVPNSFYVVVGDGDDRPTLERLARDNNVEDRVLFVGEVKADQLKSYY
jgi:phosphatidylinositol alpha-1,6-mannosyltransferase